MLKLTLSFVGLLFLVASPASAADKPPEKWTVMQLSGDARVVHPGAQPASLSVNNQLAPGDTLLTGPTGRATLVRGGDYIVIAPRSELRLPTAAQPTGFTRVIQNLGTLLFKVQHTGIPHFAVDTPMLAAVVKGTTFTVVVDQKRSAVQVIQGAVQVTAIDGGMQQIVEGGRTVFVNHDAPKMLNDADKPAAASPGRSWANVAISAAADPALANIAALTGGLVRAEVTAAAIPTTPAVPIVAAAVSGNSGTTTTPTTPTGTPVVAPAAPAVTAPVPPSATPPNPAVPPATITVPAVTTSPVIIASVTIPAVATPPTSPGSNSGSSGNSGPGSINSGSGSSNSGSGSGNSGPGSSNSGPGSSNSGPGTGATVSTPTVTVPSVTTPAVSTPVVAIPSVTTPTVTLPAVTIPTVTTASVTTPAVTVPSITTPTVSTPLVTIPSVTTPTVTVPVITLPGLKL